MNKDIMRALGLGDYVNKVEMRVCPTCDKPINVSEFTDTLSRKEFGISGMCQACQDSFFNMGEEE